MDILLEENGTGFQTAGGDLVVGDASRQHVKLLLLSAQGDWKYAYRAGINVRKFLNKTNVQSAVKHEIASQVNADGGQTGVITVDNSLNVEIEAKY